MTIEAAAGKMGIAARTTARQYTQHPAARSYYLELCEHLRVGETARNLHAAIGIRDDGEMKKSAAGNRVRIEAARFIEHRDGPPNVNVNLGVGVGVNIAPGYMVDLGAHVDTTLLRQSGSTRMLSGAGEIVDVESEPADRSRPSSEIGEHVSEAPSLSREPHFGRGTEGIPPLDSRRR